MQALQHINTCFSREKNIIIKDFSYLTLAFSMLTCFCYCLERVSEVKVSAMLVPLQALAFHFHVQPVICFFSVLFETQIKE